MRPTILPFSIWFAMFLAAVAMLVHPHGALGETMSMRDDAGNRVQLLDELCDAAPPWLGLRKARMFYQGKDYDACWRVVGRTVIVFDSAGDATPIPVMAFGLDVGT